MKKKTSVGGALTPEEHRLLEALRRRPEMMARVQSILDIARNEGALKTADQVEELLVEEMRKLGNSTLQDWAGGAQERITQELRSQEPRLRSRKKKL